jgi:hypothetical protein
MSSERQREIARKGGRAAHECGKAHEFTTDEARAAGRKGGEAVSANRSHMSEIGRLGGRRSAGRRAVANQSDGNQSTAEQVAVHGHTPVNHENALADDAQIQPQSQ